MRVSAKADYALRGMAELALQDTGHPVKAEHIAAAQGIPLKFLLVIMSQLKHAKLVRSSRGSDGGYSLSRPAVEISLAEVLRAVEGPLVDLHDSRIGELEHRGAAEPLIEVWMAVRTNVRAVLESVTVWDVASGRLPAEVRGLAGRYRQAPVSQSRGASFPAPHRVSHPAPRANVP
ncbi:MAG TPA: Rrf2 family transcriptional regulator [Candidatus Dormibacteraeota bacterium]